MYFLYRKYGIIKILSLGVVGDQVTLLSSVADPGPLSRLVPSVKRGRPITHIVVYQGFI